MQNYNRIEKIGEGTYGIVFKGRNHKTGELVAIKKIRMDADDQGVPATSVREISLLKELTHPNVVKLMDVIIEEQRLYLIFEFLTMDLKKCLDTLGPNKHLEPATVKSYAYQILQAMDFCHMRRVIHRDLKPQNLLLSSNGLIKVGDFGLGRAFGIPVRAYTHEVVTLWYRAPEVLLGTARYSTPLDIWSVGCIFAELATKKPLFQGDSEIDQLFHIFRVLTTPSEETWPGVSNFTDYKQIFPVWSQDILEQQVKQLGGGLALALLRKMLIYDPQHRIDADDALNHEYFSDIDSSKLPCYDSHYLN